MNILFFCEDHSTELLQALTLALPQHELVDWQRDRNEFDPDSIDAAICWNPPDDFFDNLSRLKIVHSIAAGVDHILTHRGLPSDITLLRLNDAGMAEQMAEYVLYGVLHAQRRMTQLREAQTNHNWAHDIEVPSASKLKVSILGAGVLGTAVACRLTQNGYKVTAWRKHAPPSTTTQATDGFSMVYGQSALSDLLPVSDVLVCLLPLTNDTQGILDAELFSQLPPGAFLINPARGAHLVDPDLINALDTGHLSGALLDVFNQEPLPDNHPLWDHPKVTITPHIAARTVIQQSVRQIVANLDAIERGDTPLGIVNRQLGY